MTEWSRKRRQWRRRWCAVLSSAGRAAHATFAGGMDVCRTTVRELREIFTKHGTVALAPIVKRGFAFIQASARWRPARLS